MSSKKEDLLRYSWDGDVEKVKALLAMNIDVNAVDSYGRTPLLLAAQDGHLNVVQNLIEAGAAIDIQDEDGETALLCALLGSHSDIARSLIKAGADVNTDNRKQITPLMNATGDADLLKLLLKKGANPNARDNCSSTAMMFAAYYGRTESVQVLLEGGTDVNLSSNQESALILATRKGHTETAKVLISADADIDTKNDKGMTALMFAAMEGNSALTQVLIDAGADANARDNENSTALIFAAKSGTKEVLQLLLKAGADVNIKNRLGFDVLTIAAETGNTECVDLLRKSCGEKNSAEEKTTHKAGATCEIQEIKMVWIAPGKFTSGLPETTESLTFEYSQEPLRIKEMLNGFWIGKYPVTNGQWKKIMGNIPGIMAFGMEIPDKDAKDDEPVSGVTWNDCQQFIAKLNGESKSYLFRLPTESEWECACRAGSKGLYCFGDETEQLCEYAWYSENAQGEKHPVGRKKPNELGIYDMHGNVQE